MVISNTEAAFSLSVDLCDSQQFLTAAFHSLFLWCRAIVDDVGDHAMSEHSVFWSSAELCWAHVILKYLDALKLSTLALIPIFFQSPPNTDSQDHYFSWCDHPWNQAAVDVFFSLMFSALLLHLLLPSYFSSRSMISLASAAKKNQT